MFLCPSCHDPRCPDPHFLKSFSPCENCGKVTDTNDCDCPPRSALKEKRARKPSAKK
jgi:hypothetical protein